MKLRTLVIISVLAVFTISCEYVFTTALDEQWGERKVYNLRDRGPAGGRIFYINPNWETDGWRYMEAAPVEAEVSRRWIPLGGTESLIGTNGNIGAGAPNTNIIKSWVDSDPSHDAPAAEYCDSSTYGNKEDWFLPSRYELNKIYENLNSGTEVVGSFGTKTYWSSSESSAQEVFYMTFANPNPNFTSFKENQYNIRCARRFLGEIY